MKYRKKPVVIEAIQWDGINVDEIAMFCNDGHGMHEDPNGKDLIIYTLEGSHIASTGDYIIKGVKGEFYPCKPDIFHMTYEEVIDFEDSEIDPHPESMQCGLPFTAPYDGTYKIETISGTIKITREGDEK